MSQTLHALGVLFVHGIGNQPQGETLLAFGEPLIQTLQEWVGGRGLGRATVTGSTLSESQLEPGEPAHTVVEVRVASRPDTTWLLAESWWAEQFRPPPFMKLAGWLLTIGPWAIISHASRWTRDAPRFQRPYQFLKVALAVPVSWLMQCVVAAVTVLAWLPIPVLQRTVSGFLLRITGTLGDSYVLLENPVQKAGAVRTLQHNIDWLAERCDRVVIVAHSQGAAIARLTLAERRHPKVCLLATFGSGVAKLTELASLSTSRRARAVRSLLAVSLVAMALLPRALTLVSDSDLRSLVWTAFLLMPLGFVVAAVTVVRDDAASWPRRAAALSLSPLEWIDYWATSDPVPNGSLAPHGTVETLTSIRITNRISWFADHSSYWENRDEFVLPLLFELSGRAGSTVVPREAPPPVAAIPSRRMRVVVLAACRAMTGLLALPLLLYAFRDKLAVYGHDAILMPLDDRPLTKPLSEALSGLGSIIGALLGPLAGQGGAALDYAGHVALGALIPLTVLSAWYRFCLVPVWKGWDAQCFRWRCHSEAIPAHPADRLLRPVLVALAALVPLAVAVRAVFLPEPRALMGEALDVVIIAPFVVMGLFFALALLVLIVGAPGLAIQWVRERLTKKGLR